MPTRKMMPVIVELNQKVFRLKVALERLQMAEKTYRLNHDLHGDDSQQAGYYWDKLRQRGDEAREILQEMGGLTPHAPDAASQPCKHGYPSNNECPICGACAKPAAPVM